MRMTPAQAEQYLIKVLTERESAKIVITGCKGCGKSSVPLNAVAKLYRALLRIAGGVVCGYYVDSEFIASYPNLVLLKVLSADPSLLPLIGVSIAKAVLLQKRAHEICTKPLPEAEAEAKELIAGMLGDKYYQVQKIVVELANALSAPAPNLELNSRVQMMARYAPLSPLLPLFSPYRLTVARVDLSSPSNEFEQLVQTPRVMPAVYICELKEPKELVRVMRAEPASGNYIIVISEGARQVEGAELIELEEPSVLEWTKYMIEMHGLQWLVPTSTILYAVSRHKGSGFLYSLFGEDIYLQCTPKQWEVFAVSGLVVCPKQTAVLEALQYAREYLLKQRELPKGRRLRLLTLLAVLTYKLMNQQNADDVLELLARELGADAVADVLKFLAEAGIISEAVLEYCEEVLQEIAGRKEEEAREGEAERTEEERAEEAEKAEEEEVEQKESTEAEEEEEEVAEVLREAFKSAEPIAVSLPRAELKAELTDAEGLAKRIISAVEKVRERYAKYKH